MDIVTFGAKAQTMTSREIAELTGKRHDHVLTDIRKMLEDLGLSSPDFSGEYKDATGRTLPCFHLDEDLSLTLVSGYSAPLRYKVVKRWKDLETGAAAPAMVPANGHSAEEALKVADAMATALRLEGSARLGVVRKAMELTAPSLLPMVPAYAIDVPTGSASGSSEPTASLTELLKEHGIKMSAVAANALLAASGLIVRMERPSTRGAKAYWSVTDAGMKYGKNVSSDRNQRETQPHWYRARFRELMGLIKAS